LKEGSDFVQGVRPLFQNPLRHDLRAFRNGRNKKRRKAPDSKCDFFGLWRFSAASVFPSSTIHSANPSKSAQFELRTCKYDGVAQKWGAPLRQGVLVFLSGYRLTPTGSSVGYVVNIPLLECGGSLGVHSALEVEGAGPNDQLFRHLLGSLPAPVDRDRLLGVR